MNYHWPGNVREMENCIQRALIVASSEKILPHHITFSNNSNYEDQPLLNTNFDEASIYEEEKTKIIKEFQKEYVHSLLKRNHGNISQSSEEAGLTRAALQRIIKNLNINKQNFK